MEKCPIHDGPVVCPFCAKTVANIQEAQEQGFIPYFQYFQHQDKDGKWIEYENPVCDVCTAEYMYYNPETTEYELLPNVSLPNDLRVSSHCEHCMKKANRQ